MAVLFAYLDESGISGSPTATVVGGLIGRLPDWAQLAGLWNHQLVADGISCFHATKCRGGHDEYHSWRPDWERMARHYVNLATIAGDLHFRPVSGSVIFADWARLDDPVLKARFTSPYAFCFELCLFHIQAVAEELGEKAVVVYAINRQYAARAAEVAAAHVQSEAYCDRIISCVPARPEDAPPLQAADMAAYEMYHLFHSKNRTKRPKLELMPRLENADLANGYFYDFESLQILSAQKPSRFL